MKNEFLERKKILIESLLNESAVYETKKKKILDFLEKEKFSGRDNNFFKNFGFKVANEKFLGRFYVAEYQKEQPFEILHNKIIMTQNFIDLDKIKNENRNERKPKVVLWRDQYVLEDGHHSFLRQMLYVGEKIKVDLFTPTEEYKLNPDFKKR